MAARKPLPIRSQGTQKYTTSSQVLADDGELLRRAQAAYFRNGGTDQPSHPGSGVETRARKSYVVLRNAKGILAVYRVRNDGMLKPLRRWPEELGDLTVS